MSTELQQGDADGLCGIYAVMNFLRSKRASWQREDASTTLCHLLEACAGFGWFTPRHITNGFEDRELKAVIDRDIDNYRLPYSAFYIDDVLRSWKCGSFTGLVDSVMERDGAIIASEELKDHWVLIEPRDGSPHVIDSSSPSNPVSPFNRRSKRFSMETGIVILKADRPVIEIAS